MLAFPCNQFGSQEPGNNDEVLDFARRNYAVTFAMHAKIDVNGKDAHPLYDHLKREAKGILGTIAIKWNFTKFLVNRRGAAVARHAPKTKLSSLTSEIEALLAQS